MSRYAVWVVEWLNQYGHWQINVYTKHDEAYKALMWVLNNGLKGDYWEL